MNARTAFWVIAVAFAVWLLLALWSERSAGGEPSDVTGPAPPSDWTLAPGSRPRRRPRRPRPLFPGWWLHAALCVHRYEGSWRDPGAPYYGGLQFDLPTWRANGGGRYAGQPDWATPTQQLRVGYTTWRRRGWWPWPTTARICGLL